MDRRRNQEADRRPPDTLARMAGNIISNPYAFCVPDVPLKEANFASSAGEEVLAALTHPAP